MDCLWKHRVVFWRLHQKVFMELKIVNNDFRGMSGRPAHDKARSCDNIWCFELLFYITVSDESTWNLMLWPTITDFICLKAHSSFMKAQNRRPLVLVSQYVWEHIRRGVLWKKYIVKVVLDPQMACNEVLPGGAGIFFPCSCNEWCLTVTALGVPNVESVGIFLLHSDDDIYIIYLLVVNNNHFAV